MSIPKPPDPAKLVIGVILKDVALVNTLAEALMDRFQKVDLVSGWMPFDYTTYYEAEMGAPLYRRMFAFKGFIDQAALPAVKQATNEIELSFTENGFRRVNIDPGYLLRERFVLATGKNFAHRIYLANGIYADLTLIYKNRAFHPQPWTYPDYAGERIQAFLGRVRRKLVYDLKTETPPGEPPR